VVKTPTTTLEYERITDIEHGVGIEYKFKDLSIRVFRAGIVLEGSTRVFRKMNEISLLRFVLEIAKKQHVQFVATKKFFPPDREWPLSI